MADMPRPKGVGNVIFPDMTCGLNPDEITIAELLKKQGPQSRTPDDDLASFRRKIDAGANAAITQYFYNPDAYFRFLDDAEVKALPGGGEKVFYVVLGGGQSRRQNHISG